MYSHGKEKHGSGRLSRACRDAGLSGAQELERSKTATTMVLMLLGGSAFVVKYHRCQLLDVKTFDSCDGLVLVLGTGEADIEGGTDKFESGWNFEDTNVPTLSVRRSTAEAQLDDTTVVIICSFVYSRQSPRSVYCPHLAHTGPAGYRASWRHQHSLASYRRWHREATISGSL